MIKDLHKLRKLFGEVEKVYKKAKSENDNRVMAYETEFHNLAKDVSNNIHAIQNEESNFHLLTMLHSKYEAKANRLRVEEEYSQTPDTPKLMGRFGTYKKMFEVINKETETSIKRMRQEKVSVRDSFATNSKQRIMFGNLKKLLQCKKDLLQEANNPQSFANSGMEFNEGGGERMMIE